MTDNRLEEIRNRQSSRRETLYGADIEYLLSLLDDRPAVATDARGLAWEIALIVLGLNSLDDLIDLPPESGNRKFVETEIAQRITAYANQRDSEVKEVLEGLRYSKAGWCWCKGPGRHSKACEAARALYEKLSPKTVTEADCA